MSIGKHAIDDPAQLQGKTVGTAGIPYQSAYLKTILDARRRRPGLGQGGQRRLQPRPGDAVQEGRRDARRLLELRGHPAAPARSSTRGSSASTRPASRPTTSSCIVARAAGPRATAARRCAASCARSARATRPLRADPQAGRRAAAGGQPGPRPRPAARERQGDAARVLPGGRQAVRLAGPARSGRRYGEWMYDNNLLTQPAGGRPRADERVPARPGAG